MNGSLNVVLFIKVFMGITFVVIGNLLTRIHPNWLIGIKNCYLEKDT